ncbi:MAG: hypothetical protein Q9173_000339 [Seirophora scorigena]
MVREKTTPSSGVGIKMGRRSEPVETRDLEKRERLREAKGWAKSGRMRGREPETMPTAISTSSQRLALTDESGGWRRSVSLAGWGGGRDWQICHLLALLIWASLKLGCFRWQERRFSKWKAKDENNTTGLELTCCIVNLQYVHQRHTGNASKSRTASDGVSSANSRGVGCASVQASKDEDTDDGNVPLKLHLKVPKPWNRQSQDCEIGYDECDEPRDDYETIANATDGEFAKGKDAVVEDKDGELQSGAGDGEDASSDEESLNQAINIQRCRRNGDHGQPNARSGNPAVKGLPTANDDALTRAKSISQSSSPYVVRVMWRARKRNTTAVVASTVNATTAPTISYDLVTAIVVEPGHSCGAYFSGINHGI